MRITYALPHTGFRKCYNKNTFFDAVNWSEWQEVVDGFQLRIVGWYFDPLKEFPKTGDEAYPVFCAMCALVDAFTHYELDEDWHAPAQYKDFLRRMNPVFDTRLSCSIVTSRKVGDSWREQTLENFADVFYTGVRCSLHHHGDLEPFAGMKRTGTLALEIPNAGRSTCGTRSYPIVVFDPWVFRDELRRWFVNYCEDLRMYPNSARAVRFRDRFKGDFAISIAEVRENV